MTQPEPLDDIDQHILGRLRQNAREPASVIAQDANINLTAGAVRRRIARLEKSGVIGRYTVAIDHEKIGVTVEAYVELSFVGNADVHTILKKAMKRPEVREAMTIAGEPDALVRLRVTDLHELRKAVMQLRKSGQVTGSKTRIVLGRHWHGSEQPDDR